MKKEKSIFTEDMSKYAAFMKATNEGLENAIGEMQQQIDARKRVLTIIEQYNQDHSISMKDLAELARISCPDFHSIDTLLELIENFNIEPAIAYIKESAYKKSLDCSGISCAQCWRNYINKTAHILNMSPIDVKNYTFNSDDEDE